ncbi:MAG TPA: PAS domain-containing protein [Chthoniobacterales bacterium]|nr:PAS domain-containing protein [Chthoniobacterales bacterium]
MDMGKEARSDIGIFDINLDTGQWTWSYELKDLFGIPRDADLNFQLVLERVHPEDRRGFNALALEPFRPDCPSRTTRRFRIVRPDGSVHWLHLVRMTLFREGATRDAFRILGFAVEISAPMGSPGPWEIAA